MTELTILGTFLHPQGKKCVVYSNNAVSCTKAGKKASTSATADKLFAGYGGWVRVADDTTVEATAAVIALPASKAAPTVTLVPMKFKEAPVADLGKFITDDNWILQQKVDGVRAQLILAAGTTPWFRNGSGAVLASAVAAATTGPILAALDTPEATDPSYMVDGEVLNGVFHAFDLVIDGGESTPFSDRLNNLTAWYDGIVAAGLNDRIHLLPTARTDVQKAALWTTIKDMGAEGVIAKRLDGGYNYGERVTHSLKLKLTHTADCVVIGVGRGAENFVLGMYDEAGTLVEVGTVSAIGKNPHGTIVEGSVIEIRTIYAGAGNRMVQPTVLRQRFDKAATDCTTAAMKFADKAVVDLDLASV